MADTQPKDSTEAEIARLDEQIQAALRRVGEAREHLDRLTARRAQLAGYNKKPPEEGDLAYHFSGLDPREVIAVIQHAGEVSVVLDVLGKPVGPVPAENYTFETPKEKS